MFKYLCIILITIILSDCSVERRNVNISKRKIDAINKLASEEEKDSIVINPPFISEPTSNSDKINYVTIDCFFGTDRNVILKGGNPYFGIERSKSGIHYGVCKVSIPKTHELGSNESPFVEGVKFLENSNKHICLIGIKQNGKITFYNDLKNRLTQNGKVNAYIFVHGYNVSFAQAAKSSAQIYYDFGLSGVPVFYSWPSQENYLKYSIDKENSEWSSIHFESFLNDFTENTKADNIYLIAHSMGNRVLINALVNFFKENEKNKNRVKEIILVAPDIDFDIFNNVVPKVVKAGRPITLYVSSNDKALEISKIINGHSRAGYSSGKPIILSGVETVDATNVNTSIIGHSYLSNSRSISDDIFNLVNNGLRASKRHLLEKKTRKGVYWEFYK